MNAAIIHLICIVLSANLLFTAPVWAEETKDITLLAVGDIMLSRHIGKVMASKGNGRLFKRISSTLKSGDIVFGNLESMLGERAEPPFFIDNPYSFLASPSAAGALKDAGFTILNLANNHAMDFGPSPISQTRELLSGEGIKTFGAGNDLAEARKPAVIEKNGLRFAFLGYGIGRQASYAGKNGAGIASIHRRYIKDDILSVRDKVDFVIVSFHWGEEYRDFPNEDQRNLAHLTIDWGADLIVGHHPHVLQGIEVYKGKIIAYSLGNFVFDQKGDGKDRSIILSCEFKGKSLKSAEIIPLDRFNAYFPKVAEGEAMREIRERLIEISLPLNADPTALEKIGLKR